MEGIRNLSIHPDIEWKSIVDDTTFRSKNEFRDYFRNLFLIISRFLSLNYTSPNHFTLSKPFKFSNWYPRCTELTIILWTSFILIPIQIFQTFFWSLCSLQILTNSTEGKTYAPNNLKRNKHEEETASMITLSENLVCFWCYVVFKKLNDKKWNRV